MGEIYVKYSPLGNNDLEKFLEQPGLRGQPARPDGLCSSTAWPTTSWTLDLYGGNKLVAGGADAFLSWLDGIG